MRSTTEYCALDSDFGRPKWPTLAELHKKLAGKSPEKKHNALDDVHTLMSCFMALCEIGFYEPVGLKAEDFRLKVRLKEEREAVGFKQARRILFVVALIAVVHVVFFMWLQRS